ncbi:uncharacterized protein LOC123516896 isoform X2 [Portunus trituberculatus]|uniref:uncharacterized protein LOC123516896 isoform X2 n=1 Tax=Portunus trituberculatus TaxID=210409 RepID=UPI001E1CFC6C|nr:uncharacterized protein LOC123516896 isoform X2 [Portunus trituberculatus]
MLQPQCLGQCQSGAAGLSPPRPWWPLGREGRPASVDFWCSGFFFKLRCVLNWAFALTECVSTLIRPNTGTSTRLLRSRSALQDLQARSGRDQCSKHKKKAWASMLKHPQTMPSLHHLGTTNHPIQEVNVPDHILRQLFLVLP